MTDRQNYLLDHSPKDSDRKSWKRQKKKKKTHSQEQDFPNGYRELVKPSPAASRDLHSQEAGIWSRINHSNMEYRFPNW